MDTYMDKDFLLSTATARSLYHEHAAGMPILDFHSHLDPEKICEDYRFRSITELWLDSGEYKWRAMRANGVSERYISGNATDWEKFSKWAETVPYLMRNPLYHWTHLELSRVFGIKEILSPATARSIYERCNDMLKDDAFTARALVKRFNVKM
ncbi:MAG: glucuronate isomerase, partial [Bacteroidaceae bacterium]|nr:glucuronate isomerase [Bacteroidaceae bacterium]